MYKRWFYISGIFKIYRLFNFIILKYILMDFIIVIKIFYNYDFLIWISLRWRSVILIGMIELIWCFKILKCWSIFLECMFISG